jgi:hypothetical protein
MLVGQVGGTYSLLRICSAGPLMLKTPVDFPWIVVIDFGAVC